MMLAKDLKELINRLPDDMPVMLGGTYDCDIVGYHFTTEEWVARLELTKGYSIVRTDFMDRLFEDLKKARCSQ